MPYRRTENVVRRLATRQGAILAAARAYAAERGMAAVQIASVAARAGIAAGTVYRYFPAKTDLVAALVASVSDDEIGALRRAADAAPGPLSALAAAIATFASRARAQPRLAWAVLGEPVDPRTEGARRAYRKVLAAELETRIERAVAGGYLPAQNARLSAAAMVGSLIEALTGPLAFDGPNGNRDAADPLTLFVLRGLGLADARARGLVASQRTNYGRSERLKTDES